MHKTGKTHMARKEDTPKQWFLLDASGKTLGRMAAEITKILRGKHRPTFTPHADTGDGVVIINAGQVKLTGAKEAQKKYYYYTGYIGGQREIAYRDMKAKKPTFMLEHAVKGMMPKTKLAKAQLKRLRLYSGSEHDMIAQKPVVVEV